MPHGFRCSLCLAMAQFKSMTGNSCKVEKCHQSLALCFNVILQVLLFLLFLIYFGIPSVEKYLEKQTIVITSEEITNGIEAPAITIVALNSRSIPGWKSVDQNLNFNSFSMVRHCQRMNFTDMGTCKTMDTLNLGDFLHTARLGVFEESSTPINSSNSSSMWTEDMAATYIGRFFTLKLSTTITPSPDHTVVFNVNASFQFNIWVHDENFFLVNQNHFGLPSKLWKISGNELAGGEGLYYEITLTKHKKLNLERQPCEEDPIYRFRDCNQSCKKLHSRAWEIFGSKGGFKIAKL